MRTAPQTDAPPCVIASGPLRGGSTLLRLMLDGHSALSCVGESDFLVDHIRAGRDGEWRYDRAALESDRIFRASGLRLRDDLDGAAAFRDMVRQIGRNGAAIPVLMLHRGIDAAARLTGGAPILRLTRDPRDAARSAVGMGWAGTVWHGADPWIRTEREWRAFADRRPAARVHRVRFEDLVSEPEASLRAACGFLGLAYDASLLAYPATTTYDAPDAALAHQWRRRLTEREVALVEHRIGPLLQGSGYAPAGVPSHAPSVAERLRLAVANRVAVWRWMVARFGLAAPVLRGIGRRLGLRGLARAAQRRMDVTTIKYLK